MLRTYGRPVCIHMIRTIAVSRPSTFRGHGPKRELPITCRTRLGAHIPYPPPSPSSRLRPYRSIRRMMRMRITNPLGSSLVTRTMRPVLRRRSFVAAARGGATPTPPTLPMYPTFRGGATTHSTGATYNSSRMTHPRQQQQQQQRSMSFIFTGRRLEDILKKDLVHDKTSTEVADLWYAYHDSKINVHGLVIQGHEATTLLQRAASTPFFIQPVFKSPSVGGNHQHGTDDVDDDHDDEFGYFMVVSQYQAPCHFLMAYLEDFKRDPTSAQPLLTFSVYDDYATSKDVGLVRAEIINKGIDDEVGRKIVLNMMDAYMKEDEYKVVHAFNKEPETFDFDDFLARQNEKWRRVGGRDVPGTSSSTVER